MKILITGVAGFIGFSCAKKLLNKKIQVVGIDNFDPYYNTKIKIQRIKILKKYKKFKFIKCDIKNRKLNKKISSHNFTNVLHFAAQPGVRYSLINPKKYFEVNVRGFQNILESIKINKIKSIIYASSSSVYGDQKKFPVNEKAFLKAKNPYGVSKIINENTAEIYSKIFKVPFIGLRFFTIYGEWGRPDMFILKLLNSIYKNKVFELNNAGDHFRDFTYVGDVADICYKFIKNKAKKNNEIYNVCAGQQVNIKKLKNKIKSIYPKSKIVNTKAHIADIYKTFGDNKKLVKELKIKKFMKIGHGLKNTISWFEKYKHLNLF